MTDAPARTGLALAVTVALAYTACALFFWMSPSTATAFMNGLFHGLDFGKLQGAPGAFSFGGFAAALVVMTLWAFVLGAVFSFIRAQLARQ